MLRRFTIIFILFFSFLFTTEARATDLMFSEDVNITIGANNYIIVAGSVATSFTVNDNSIDITMPSNATLNFKSENKYMFDNDPYIGHISCNDNYSVLIITQPGTFTITPDTTRVCSNSGSGGGSGAPSSTPVVTTPPVTTPPVVDAPPVVTPPINTPPVSVPVVNTPVLYNLGISVLKNGSKGEPVKELQKFLNTQLNLNLKIDGKLGPKTISLIKKWQKDNGLKPDGIIGPKTKAKINSLAN